MEGTIKYVNPEQKYGYIKAEGEHDISFKMKVTWAFSGYSLPSFILKLMSCSPSALM